MLIRWLLLIIVCSACRTPPPAAVSECTQLLPMQSFNIASSVLNETRRINVYTPPKYGEETNARYAVLYMPDGGLAEDFIHVAEALHFGITWELLRPVIVVGIENTERRRDLTGPTEVEEDKKIAPRVGGSAAFRSFIRDELMPQIRERYRTTNETAIVGESLAGLFVVETFFLEPTLFDAFIAFSPSVWWNGGALIQQASERLKNMPAGKTLYITSADEENILPGLQRLADILKAEAPAGLTWSYYPKPDEFHDTIYRASAPRAFRVLFAPKRPL